MVNPLSTGSHQSSDILDRRGVLPEEGEAKLLYPHSLRSKLIPANVVAIGDDSMVVCEVLLLRYPRSKCVSAW